MKKELLKEEDLRKEIWEIIMQREKMGLTNPCYTEKRAFEERLLLILLLIKELEQKYNCKIDVWNNITFLEE